jgi:hypothetical protein
MKLLKQWDLMFGAAGTGATFSLSTLNAALGCVVGVLTIALMLLRLARELSGRNKPNHD